MNVRVTTTLTNRVIDAERFWQQGFLVIRGLLDPIAVIDPLRNAYGELIDALTEVFKSEAGHPQVVDQHRDAPLPRRLAVLVGLGGHCVLDHLDPNLNLFSDPYGFRGDLPSAQIPELFALIRSDALLGVLRELLGSEIYASPIHHLNFKLGREHLQLAADTVTAAKSPHPREIDDLWNFHLGTTIWHMDASAGLKDSFDSSIINAWVPMTTSHQTNGRLQVIPGSHAHEVRRKPMHEEFRKVVGIDAEPGDVVLMHNKLFHASQPNTSTDEYRAAVNVRYLPVGQNSGRPYLPGFVAYSQQHPEKVLRNPLLWTLMWRHALEYVGNEDRPSHNLTLDERKSAAITRRWQPYVDDPMKWLTVARDQRASVGMLGNLTRRLGLKKRTKIVRNSNYN